nr:aciniform spidroin [Pardosa pseudoannulata]
MNWLTSFSFLILLFVTQQVYVESRKGGFGNASKSPWADVGKANAFMKCLIQKIANSPVFPQQEKEDMESIVETMMSAISSMSTSQRGNSHAQLQAMNMAFASSMAELVIAEDAGNMKAISVKTDALSQTLKTCFQTTMGTVNRQFIAEIKDLINVFAQEAASAAEENDIDEGGNISAQDMATQMTQSNYNTNTYTNTGTTNNFIETGSSRDNQMSYQDFNQGFPAFGSPAMTGYGAPGAGAPGAGPSGDLSGITNNLAQALASSSTFRAIFRAGVSSQIATRIATSAVQSTLSSSLRVDAGISGRIVNDLQSAVLNIGAGADVNAYASAVARTVVSGLASGGVLSAANASDLGVNIASGFIQAASGIAAQFGIRISASDVSNDIRTVTNMIRSSTTSQTTTTSVTSAVSGQTSVDAGSQAGFGLGASGPLDFGSPDFGAGPAGSPGYGAPGAGAPGAGPSGDLSGITNNLAQALASSSTFRAIFRAGVSSQIATRIATSAVQSTLSSSLRVDAGISGRIVNDLQSAVLNIGAGADVNAYASAVARTVVSGLASGGVLSAANASDLGVNIASGFIQAASGIAAQFGIRISASDVSNDIRTVTNMIRSSTTSQTTTTSVTSAVSGQTSVDAGSQAGFGLGASGPLDFGSPDFGAGPAGSPGYGAPGAGAPGAGPSGDLSGITNNLAQALASSSTFRAIFRAGVSSQIATRIATSAVQSTLSSSLRVDAGISGRIVNDLQSAVLNIGAGADVNAYASAVARTVVSGLASGGVLSAANASDLGVNIASGFIQAASGIAAQFGIRISASDVSNDIRTVTNMIRSSTTSQTTTTSVTSAVSGQTSVDAGSQAGFGLGASGPLDFGSPDFGAGPAGSPGYGAPGAGAPGAGPSGDLSGITNNLAQALASSSTFRAIFRAGVSSQIATRIATSAVQSTLSSSLRVDAGISGRIVNDLQSAVLNIGAGADVNAYASAVARTVVSGLASGGVLSAANASDLGVNIASGFIQAASGIAAQFGIRISASDVSNDIRTVTNMIRSSTTSQTTTTSVTSAVSGQTSVDAGSQAGFGLGASGPLDFGSPDFGAGSPGYGAQGAGAPGAGPSGDLSGITNNLAQALASSSTFRAIFRAGVSSQIATRIATSAVQSTLSSSLRVDAGISGRIVNDLQSAVLNIGAGADVNAYASAVARTVVSGLASGGVLSAANASDLGVNIASGFIQAASGIAAQFGIRISASDVSNDIRTVTNMIRSSTTSQTTTTSVTSAVSGQTSVDAGSQAGFGLGASGPLDFGSPDFGAGPAGSPGYGAPGAGAPGAGPSGDLSGITNNLAQALASSSTFRAIFRAGVSSQIATRIATSAVQSTLSSSLRVDAGISGRIVNDLQSAVLNIGAGADVNAYASAVARTVVSGLASGGVLSAANASDLGVNIASGFIQAASGIAAQFGIRISASDVSNDIRTVTNMIRSSTTSQTTTTSVTSAVSGQTSVDAGSQAGFGLGASGPLDFGSPDFGAGPAGSPGYGAPGAGAPGAGPSGDLSGITNNLAQALASSSTFRAIFRAGVSSQIATRIATSAVQSTLSSSLRVDAGISGRIVNDLQSAVLNIGAGADVNAYASAVARTVVSGLASGGVLSAANASDLGVNIASGFIQAASGIAAQFGIRISASDVSNDIRTVTNMIRSSTTSQTTTTSVTSAVSGQTSVDAGSQAGFGLGASGPLDFGSPDFGAGPAGSPGYGAPGAGAPGAGPSGDLSGITNNLAQALASSSTFRAIFRAGVSSQIATRIATSAVQSTLSSSLRVDAGISGRIVNDLQSAVLNIGAGADVNAYASAVARTVVSGLASGGVLSAANASDLGVNIASGFIQAASGIAAQFGIRISASDVSNDIRTVTNMIRSSTTSQTTTTSVTSAVSGQTSVDAGSQAGFGLGASGPLDFGSPDFGAGPAGSPGYGAPGAGAPGAGPSGDLSGITNNLAQALASSSTFRAIFRAGVSSQIATRIATSAVQSTLSSSLRVDAGISGRIVNDLQSAVLNIGAGADVNAYASAVARTVVSGLASGGVLSAANASDLGVNIASGFIQAASGIAAQFGIRISASDVSNDIRTVTNMIRSSTTSQTTTTSVTSAVSGQTSVDAGSQAGFGLGASGPLDFGSPDFGAGPAGSPGYGAPGAGAPGAGPSGDLSGITNNLAQALASSSTFRAIFRAGVSSQIATRIATSAVQSTLSSSLRVDAGISGRIVNDLQSAVLNIGAGADVNAYASAVARTVVSGLASGGVLSAANASDLGVNIASGFIQAASGIAAQFGIRISASDVSNDIRTVTNMIRSSTTSQTTTTSVTSAVSGQTSVDAGSQAGFGLGASGPLDFGSPDFGAGSPGYGAQGAGAPGAGPSGDLSGITNNLAQALASSSTFRAIFRAGVSSQIATRIATSAVQSTLSSSLRVDAGISGRIVNDLQSAVLNIGAGADVNAYASAVARTVVSGLASGGVLSAANASDLGVNIASGFIQAASGIAAQFGIRISSNDLTSDIINVKNMIQSSVSSLTNSVSSSVSSSFDASVGSVSSSLSSGMPSSGSGYPGLTSPADSFGALLSSPSGLTSPRAVSRMQSLASRVLNSMTSGGLDVGSFAQSIAAITSDLTNSGLSRSDAKVEALLEAMVVLIQLLSSARIGPVNVSSAAGISSSFASSLSTVLVN